jgi:hypothetical protein
MKNQFREDKIEAKDKASKLLRDCKGKESDMIPFLVCKNPATYIMIPKNLKKKEREIKRLAALKKIGRERDHS